MCAQFVPPLTHHSPLFYLFFFLQHNNKTHAKIKMVAIILLGAGGVGKTTLLKEFVASHPGYTVQPEVARCLMAEKHISQADLKNPQTFWDLQLGIARRQQRRETEFDMCDSIADRCVIDALAYAAGLQPERFPLIRAGAPLKFDAAATHELFQPLLGEHSTTGIAGTVSPTWQADVDSMVSRYKHSLVVLVYPFTGTVQDDGTRKVMSAVELQAYTERCATALQLLGVPFLHLKACDLGERVQTLHDAVRDIFPPLSTP
jgi:predicted ATPase